MASEDPIPEASVPSRPGPVPAGAGPAPAEVAGPAPADAVGPAPAEVGACRSDGRWSVARLRWKTVLPDLPDDVAALIAAPIVVWFDPPGSDRGGGDDDEEEQRERYPSPADPCAVLRVPYGGRRPGFLAPAGLGPASTARHRI